MRFVRSVREESVEGEFATKAEAKAEADRRIALQPAWQMTFVAEWPA